MAVSEYWVGQIPAKPLAIEVRDAVGSLRSVSLYSGLKAILVDPDDEPVDITGSVLQTSGTGDGRVVFRWPTDRSLFIKTGVYLLQLELDGPTSKDFTTAHALRVRKLGGNNK